MTIGIAHNGVERRGRVIAAAATATTPGGWWAANGELPLTGAPPMRCVLSSAMPLRYDRLCRITSRRSVRSEKRGEGLVCERRRDGILFLYGDRGGCPVFRVTWLNGIALAHSCPLRRDGRLASRFFPSPLFSFPRFAPSKRVFLTISRISLVPRLQTLAKTVPFFGCGNQRSAARLVTMLEYCESAMRKNELFPLDSSWICDCDCQRLRLVLNFTLMRDSQGNTIHCKILKYVIWFNRIQINRCTKWLDDILRLHLEFTLKINKFYFWLLNI